MALDKLIRLRLLGLYFAFSIMLVTPIGFDYYWYGIAYPLLGIDYWDLVFGVPTPRYWLTSYTFYFLNQLIPIGWLVLMVVTLPSFHILKSLMYEYERGVVMRSFLFIVLCYFTIYISSTGITLLWLAAYYLTSSRVYMLGVILSPLGIVYHAILAISVPGYKFNTLVTFIMIALFFALSYTLVALFFSDVYSYRFNITIQDLTHNIDVVFKRKGYIILLLLMALVVFLLSKIKLSEPRIKNLKSIFFLGLVSLPLILIVFTFVNSKQTALSALAGFSRSSVVCITWLPTELCLGDSFEALQTYRLEFAN